MYIYNIYIIYICTQPISRIGLMVKYGSVRYLFASLRRFNHFVFQPTLMHDTSISASLRRFNHFVFQPTLMHDTSISIGSLDRYEFIRLPLVQIKSKGTLLPLAFKTKA